MEEKNNGEGKGGKYLERENVTMAGQTTNKERSGFFWVKIFGGEKFLGENCLWVKKNFVKFFLGEKKFL